MWRGGRAGLREILTHLRYNFGLLSGWRVVLLVALHWVHEGASARHRREAVDSRSTAEQALRAEQQPTANTGEPVPRALGGDVSEVVPRQADSLSVSQRSGSQRWFLTHRRASQMAEPEPAAGELQGAALECSSKAKGEMDVIRVANTMRVPLKVNLWGTRASGLSPTFGVCE